MAKSIVSSSASSSADVDGLVVVLHGAFGARATAEISSVSALPVLEMAPGGEEEEAAGEGFSESAETAFFNTQVQKRNVLPPHMATAFFTEGVKNFFSCVNGSEMAIGEVKFLADIAWVKRGGGRGGEEIF